MGLLDEVIARVRQKPAAERQKIIQQARKATAKMPWIPNPGPQTDAYLSVADILLYGGQAGGGKSQELVGWGVNEAETGIIFRRELSQTDGLEADGKQIIARAASFNGTDHEWTWPGGKTLKLGGMRNADDWIAHAGRERDYIGFDEAGEFLEVQVASLRAWLRAPPGKRTRMILASNPPRTAEGLWLLDWFAPWLDDEHPLFPAAPGAILWAVYVGNPGQGRTEWVAGPGEYEFDGKKYTAESRTFIPASLEDNPFRNTPEYRAKLQSLPEPLRSQLLYGDWKAGLSDAANQMIPTEWVLAAQRRWKNQPPEDIPMCAIGVDASGGGDDAMIQAIRYDGWFAPLVETPGKDIPRNKPGSHAAGLILSNRRDNALVVVDMGGGYGGPIYEHLTTNEIETMAYKGAEATTRRTRDKKLAFTNTRTAAYWGFREALDPDQPGGSPIALPPGKRLLAGLCAPTFEVTAHGIKAEPKSKREGGVKGVVERLGWSPNEADAVVMSWWGGPRETTNALDWRERKMARGMGGQRPQVIMGRKHARR